MKNAFLGVDVGSISTKGVIIDENNTLLASEYIWTDRSGQEPGGNAGRTV